MRFHEEPDVVERVRDAAQGSDRPLVLAVSGGLDSVSLLDAMALAAPERIAAVAAFDHATGPEATRAVAHVRSEARRRGLPFVAGRMPRARDRSSGLEAMWRTARYEFLREVARVRGARVVTAHTRDDQIETVLLRILRGAGARGLAGLEAPGPIMRPLLDISRASLERFALARGLEWVIDPSNARLDFLRNRVRHELLPAMRRVDASIDEKLWSVGRRAARWRAEVEALVDAAVPHRRVAERTLVVAASELAGFDRDSLSVLWGALAGRVGLALDRRGTTRCASFTMKRPRGGWIPLSRGWRLEAVRDRLVLHGADTQAADDSTLPEAGSLEWGEFRFSLGDEPVHDDEWNALLSGPSRPVVRRWRAGDRLAPSRGQGRRRVARYLSEARIVGSVRAGWPVVVQGDEVVWIPGVRRSDAATVRSGRPTRRYVCERAHG
jgi:tRNA(Ile)-lysidine synthase